MLMAATYTRASEDLHRYVDEHGLRGTPLDPETQQRQALARRLQKKFGIQADGISRTSPPN